MPSIGIVAEEFDCTVVKKERPHVRRHKKSEVEGGQKKREQDRGAWEAERGRAKERPRGIESEREKKQRKRHRKRKAQKDKVERKTGPEHDGITLSS